MGVTDKQYGKVVRPMYPDPLYLNSSTVSVDTMSSEIDAVLDKSAVGAVRKVKVVSGLTASSSARTNAGWTIPSKVGIEDVALDVQTASTAGTINVGTPSSESGGDENGYLAGADITSTGLVGLTSTNAGVLLHDSSELMRTTDFSQSGYALTYQNSSGPISSDFSANLVIWYTEFA